MSHSMACTTPPVVPTDSRKIVIKGLEKVQHTEHIDQAGDGDEHLETPTFFMIMHEEEPLSELWNRIEGCKATSLAFEHRIDMKQIRASISLLF